MWAQFLPFYDFEIESLLFVYKSIHIEALLQIMRQIHFCTVIFIEGLDKFCWVAQKKITMAFVRVTDKSFDTILHPLNLVLQINSRRKFANLSEIVGACANKELAALSN